MTKKYECACGNVIDEVVEIVTLYDITLDNIPHYLCSDCGADTIPRKFKNKFRLAANKPEEKSELEIAVDMLKEEGWTSEEIREAIDKMFNEDGIVLGSAFDWTFEDEDNEYDEKYKDFI